MAIKVLYLTLIFLLSFINSQDNIKKKPVVFKSKVFDQSLPVIKIGILSMELNDTVSNILIRKSKRRYRRKTFRFRKRHPVLSKKKRVLKFVENIDKHTYIPTSYIKNLLHFKNVIVVPLNSRSSRKELIAQIENLDGFLLTGGSGGMTIKKQIMDNLNPNAPPKIKRVKSPLFYKIRSIRRKAVKMNKAGKYFPIWATCFGFQALVLSYAKKNFKMSKLEDKIFNRGMALTDEYGNLLDEKGMDNPYDFIPWYGEILKAPSTPMERFMRENYSHEKWNKIYYYKHVYGFKLRKFQQHKRLMRRFKILAVSDLTDFGTSDPPELFVNRSRVKDEYSTMFVAAIEHKKFPFYGVQFHPEKSGFDYKRNKHVLRDGEAIKKNNLFMKFFIDEIRYGKLKNNNPSQNLDEVYAKLPTNLNVFRVKKVGHFKEILVFNNLD